MNIAEWISNNRAQIEGIDRNHFLIGLLSAFENRYQAAADKFFEEMSWKQFFAIICIDLSKQPPTLTELSDIMGSSHQNVKQILIKLEKKGFVSFYKDEHDKRKEHILLTEKTKVLCDKYSEESNQVMEKLFKGLTPEQIDITIQTIIKMENNIKDL